MAHFDSDELASKQRGRGCSKRYVLLLSFCGRIRSMHYVILGYVYAIGGYDGNFFINFEGLLLFSFFSRA